MRDVQKEIYYVVFTDRETGLIAAKNYIDYESAVERAIMTRRHERYYDVYVTRVINVEIPH
ncbi:hypothetical protein [Idiomarina abyssalis]|uniref:hypothetical protein n=1 Tax=Idiomarina abyssalis TaxID=86102 RepID=UPI000C5A419D|nr:hypothetical protein [Idiomarina abyssalis]MBP58030.1 hypothetical protein [Idiomarina sp.]|tara:strand:- start:3243 stop:3425 length:183 start_codon:yes stop_codon:yes gene_type:complete